MLKNITVVAPNATTGLSPTVTVYSVPAGALAYSASPMGEIGGGIYNASVDLDGETEYAFVVDLGSAFTSTSRYPGGRIDKTFTPQTVWDYVLPTAPADGTAAKYLRSSGPNMDVAAGNIVGYNGLSAKDAKKEFESVKQMIAEIKESEREEEQEEPEEDEKEDIIEAVKLATAQANSANLEAISELAEFSKNIASSVEEIKGFVDKKELEELVKEAENEVEDEMNEFQELLDEAEFLALAEKAVESMEESGTIVSKKKKKKQ